MHLNMVLSINTVYHVLVVTTHDKDRSPLYRSVRESICTSNSRNTSLTDHASSHQPRQAGRGCIHYHWRR